jgi:dTDP-4-dehydrorhamnose reductase
MKRTDRTKVVVLGSTGMAGHVACAMLSRLPELQVFNIARTVWNDETIIIDARDRTKLDQTISSIGPDIIINCMGVLIKGSEKDPKSAIEINSLLPHFLVDLCDRYGGRLVHLSTDCVFSGKCGPYKTTDFRDGDSIYDRSKALGEVINQRDLTIRTSIVGPELKKDGTGLFHWFMGQQGSVKGYTQALWSGVMTTDLALFLQDICLGSETSTGLVHYSVPGGISKFELLSLFQSEFRMPVKVERFENEPVDKRLILSDSLLHKPLDYISQVRQMKAWMVENKNWYGHYSER